MTPQAHVLSETMARNMFVSNNMTLCRNAFDLNHYTNVEIAKPQFPSLYSNQSLSLELISQFRKVIEQRNNKKKKKVDDERHVEHINNCVNPLRLAAVSGDLNGIKEWAKGYSINARGGYKEPTILIDAVIANVSLDAIKLIIELGAFVNAVDSMHRTALHHACQIGSVEVAKLLLKNGAQYFLRDYLGRTPFHIVAAHSSTKCLILILHYTKGSEEINHGDNEGMTPIHWAVAKDHTEHLDILLSKKYHIDLKRTDIEGKTALHWCANHILEVGNYKESCAYKLLNACQWGILNYKDIDGRTVLHLACGENNLGLVHLLASHPRCDINAQDDMKRTALHWAAVAGYSNIVEVLLKYKADDSLSDATKATALHYAASKNHIQCVSMLTEGRKYAYLPDAEGRTPAVWAILKGHVQTLRLLLDKGVDIETRDLQKCTPLHAAASSGNTMCASLLLQSGSQIDAVDLFSRTALFKTIENGHAETAALLIQKGADCSISDEDGRRPIHFAALFGHLNVLSLLLASGSDPNSKDDTGKTPLHCAAYNGNLDAIRFLIQSNANPNIRDYEGITALHWACGAGKALSVELLLALGANPNMTDFCADSERNTPLDYAISVRSYDCIQLLKKFGGLTAAELIKKSGHIILKYWRNYRRKTAIPNRSTKIAIPQRKNIPARRLSATPMPEPIMPKLVPNLNRRHSKAGLASNRRNSILDYSILIEDETSNLGRETAASKIQRAWKRHCLRMETKFLIQVMGPEEASSMIDRLILKEREQLHRKALQDYPRRKSRRASDASKLFFDFPSKTNAESRRSSFSMSKNEYNGPNFIKPFDGSSDLLQSTRRTSAADVTRLRQRFQSNTTIESFNSSINSEYGQPTKFLDPNFLNGARTISRTPTVFNITMTADELAYLAMEQERSEP